jgi:UDP-N-acetylmuramate dehydrogenase
LPGTVGGAVFGNAGCYGGDIAAVLTRAWLLLDGEVVEWPVERFAYAYRTSALRTAAPPRPPGLAPAAGPIVVAAEFGLTRADPQELAEQMRRIAAERRSKTPVGSSCGSVFKNPPGASAGRLIEAAGLKGCRVGGAEISRKHANYIVNCGGASSDDVLRLIDLARERVVRAFGVALELEVQIVG